MAQSLASVKYSSILPIGKTSNYTEQEKLQFEIPSRYMYLDGKQSYLYLEVDNTSTFDGTDISAPVVYQPHIGVSSLVERVQLQELVGSKDIEDIDGYNTFTGIRYSYGFDFDTYDTLARVEQVTAHNPLPQNCSIGDPKNQYFTTAVDTSAVADEFVGGNVAITASSCMPIHLGLFSNFEEGDHKVFPNGPLGGTRLNLYLEKAKVALCEPANVFLINQDNVQQKNPVNITDPVECDGVTSGDYEVTIDINQCDMSITPYENISYRVGMPFEVLISDVVDVEGVINSVTDDGTQLVIGLSAPVTQTSNDVGFRVKDITRGFNIKKAELRVLETLPTNINGIQKALSSGINYKTVQLNKLSSPAGLVNTILDLPAVVERGNSILVVPCAADNLDELNSTNSRMYPQQEDNNTNTYQFQIQNYLIPNRSVLINKVVNAASDNTLYYQQLTMAMRTFLETRCFTDGMDASVGELSNPLVYPLQLAPTNTSYRLIDSEPQLRITNSSSGNTTAKLFYVFTIHTRKLMTSNEGNVIEL